jgi:phosphatidylethanolamine-binding protein (PEBP) family uncharacterized protein
VPAIWHGIHHYRFTLSAVSEPLSLPEGSTIDELRVALADSRVLSEATLVGTYER